MSILVWFKLNLLFLQYNMGGMLRGGSHQGNKKRQKQEKTQIREEKKKEATSGFFPC
jgi:hypothetical protein